MGVKFKSTFASDLKRVRNALFSEKMSHFTQVESSQGYENYAIHISYVVFCAKYTFFEVFVLLQQINPKMYVLHISFGNSIPFLKNFCHIMDILKLQMIMLEKRKPIRTTYG